MPANLPPQYYRLEQRYRFVQTNQEKLAILRKMFAIMPKHKGTDKLQADLKYRISQLRKEMQKKHAPGKSTYSFHIPKEGAGQVVLIGAPNAGKSQILQRLTNVAVEVAPYPFTTRKPVVGMMKFENIGIQLVDTPPLTANFIESYLLEIVKNADLILLVANLDSDGVLEETEEVRQKLSQSRIGLGLEKEQEERWTYKKTMMVGNKVDIKGADERLEILRELYGQEFPIISVSAKETKGLDELKAEIYKALNIIRVYTKQPGKPPDRDDPIVLKRGSTVIDAAITIHKEFASKLKYARIWDEDKLKGQRVERDGLLKDGDILEFHV